ncbi:GAF domain-containing protein [Cellulomonas aerilata]|uniref:Transcription antitermination regulator n=1 Tax=Cellulomonas aerilata TaxID=515326 RepID=A0A512D866_9CELL|nr:GAF domain-containing protein [Cellulomonas aerilata]GEO32575.1 transcription antitermination regulator [Cellulomonas aerilata]
MTTEHLRVGAAARDPREETPTMEPIPETREALRSLSVTSPSDVEASMRRLAELVLELVPTAVGLSLSVREAGLTFTMVSTDERVAALDGVQYLGGGPCVDAARTGDEVAMDDSLSEQRWHEYALAACATGVRSSLSIPVLRGEEAVGALNLYAADPHGFDGRADALRALVRASTGLAAANADLSFSSRAEAQTAPGTLRERGVVDTAVGFLAASRSVSIREARQLLDDAAVRAKVDVPTLAATVLRTPGPLDAL